MKQQLAQKDDDLRLKRERAKEQKRQTAAVKGQLTKVKKRVAGGVCPCCNRSFVNLKRHMASKHPDYTEKPDLEVISGGKK